VTAYFIYRTRIGFKVFRAAVFMPSIISAVIIGLIFSILFNADFGPINIFLKSAGLASLERAWLSTPSTVLGVVIAPQVWQQLGYYAIIYLAAMQSIPRELIESAQIDGANSFVVFRKIVLPLITEISQIVIILVVTNALKSFGFSWAMTKGGPVVFSSFFTVYMYRTAFVDSNFGLSSAVSFNILVYAMTFTIAFKWIFRRFRNEKA
jgi:raffinose/stachyose/melibiose transport system permease protein